MGKKPRSQRRKKGGGMDEDDTPGGEAEFLSEEHTIADSVTTFSQFDDDFAGAFRMRVKRAWGTSLTLLDRD